MPSYLITGVSRGLGWGFLEILSADPNNTIAGIVRNKSATDKRVASELKGRTNIAIFEADLTSYDALKTAVDGASAYLGGKVDYVFANAAVNTLYELFDDVAHIGNLGKADDSTTPAEVEKYFHEVMTTNVLSVYNLYTLTIPMVLRGEGKKVMTISSGHGSLELANAMEWKVNSMYAASKAAVNIITAKFAALYSKDGVLFYNQCPGIADDGQLANATPQQMAITGESYQGFAVALPQFEDIKPEMLAGVSMSALDSARNVLRLFDEASLEKGYSGAFKSHFGTRFRPIA